MSKESKHSSLVTGMTENEAVVSDFQLFCEGWRLVHEWSKHSLREEQKYLREERDIALSRVAGDTTAEQAISDACSHLILPESYIKASEEIKRKKRRNE